MPGRTRVSLLVAIGVALGPRASAQSTGEMPPTVAAITARLNSEAAEAYAASRLGALSKDYFNRFSRDYAERPAAGEIEFDSTWRLTHQADLDPLGKLMGQHLQQFLRDRMDCDMASEVVDRGGPSASAENVIVLLDSSGGEDGLPESFTITVEPRRIIVAGNSPVGLRDGIVRLVDRIGLRSAPLLELGTVVYRPRLRMRVSAVPAGGSAKDAVFFGANAVIHGGGDLFALSTSNAIPELASRRDPTLLKAHRDGMGELSRYGLKAYAWLNTREKFAADDPVFKAHPGIRGSLTWSSDGEYCLCTSHPLVRQYLCESLQGLFRSQPELAGAVLIVGGEGFYHCHMRPFGVANGHTNCDRCEPLAGEQAVAELANKLSEAVREVNPEAEVVLWPYSAEHVWAADKYATGLITRLGPGAALLTEIEKSEMVSKPLGVQKSIWDYSIDFIGPAARARQQISICRTRDIPVYLKSEPEMAFEAPRLPHVPCMDRWADRAEALAASKADGAWVFPAFRPFYGSASAEIYKHLWWTPTPDRESLLSALAQRIAGRAAAKYLRRAWRETSAAISWSPELPPYYTGPHYLGPMHPMCADRGRPLPEVFLGQYLFRAEHMDSEGLKKRPTFDLDRRGHGAAFGASYEKMAKHMAAAAAAIADAEPLIEPRCRLAFDDEASAVRWLHHTARSHANFYKSCELRDALTALAARPNLSEQEKAAAAEQLARWRDVLEDERENTRTALPVLQGDMRLDPYFGGDHSFSHGEAMITAKLDLLDQELTEFLPQLADRIEH